MVFDQRVGGVGHNHAPYCKVYMPRKYTLFGGKTMVKKDFQYGDHTPHPSFYLLLRAWGPFGPSGPFTLFLEPLAPSSVAESAKPNMLKYQVLYKVNMNTARILYENE